MGKQDYEKSTLKGWPILDIKEIEAKADDLRKKLGGKILAFPIHEADPYSKYAVVIYTGAEYKTFPDSLTIEEAAAGIRATLEGFADEGWDADYDRNVRFVSYEAQINAPSVTMRRLKKEETKGQKPFFRTGVDIKEKDSGADYHISARGLIKLSYIMMVDEKNKKAAHFMDEYYKLLATKKYGKTAGAIKQEVRRMNKDQANRWIEQTYNRYIHDDMEVFDITNKTKTTS